MKKYIIRRIKKYLIKPSIACFTLITKKKKNFLLSREFSLERVYAMHRVLSKKDILAKKEIIEKLKKSFAKHESLQEELEDLILALEMGLENDK